tara:strand:+ start:4149 stop:4301 length:153 start_codon:yes stop_codon:yes gene_type:complete
MDHDFSDWEIHDAPRCDHGLDQPSKEWHDEKRKWVCPRCDPELYAQAVDE